MCDRSWTKSDVPSINRYRVFTHFITPSVKINPGSFNVRSIGIIWSFDGQLVPHVGETDVVVDLAGRPVAVRVLCCFRVLPGIDAIVGMDVLSQHVMMVYRGSSR